MALITENYVLFRDARICARFPWLLETRPRLLQFLLAHLGGDLLARLLLQLHLVLSFGGAWLLPRRLLQNSSICRGQSAGFVLGLGCVLNTTGGWWFVVGGCGWDLVGISQEGAGLVRLAIEVVVIVGEFGFEYEGVHLSVVVQLSYFFHF